MNGLHATARRSPLAALALGLAVWTGSALAAGASCTQTVIAQYRACSLETGDDYFTQVAICHNESDPGDRSECLRDAYDEKREAALLCRAQLSARFQLCQRLGQAPYDPDWEAEDFDDNFEQPENPNPWFPLTIGSQWEYESEDETITVEVLDETKLIDGVRCIVVNDVVAEDDEVIEDTDDWFALSFEGDVYYCGELARDFETFEDDEPALPELIEIEGSFKAGRDGDKPGVLFFAEPEVGVSYRQEWSPGNAEDVATVLSISYRYGDDADLDQLVPEELAELLCDDGDCVVTRDYTPLEPGVFERKYYARGIGPFLEVNMEDEEIAQLVGCNFDARCDELPEPDDD